MRVNGDRLNRRIAELFMALRSTDWKLRARKHIQAAKRCGDADARKLELDLEKM